MRKEAKENKVSELKQMSDGAAGLVLLSCSGVGAQQMAKVRSRMRQSGCPIKVVRNTLFRLALQGTSAQPLEREVRGPLAVLACGEDLVAGAKTALSVEAEAPGLRIKAAFLANRIRSREEVVEIGGLPPREALVGQLVFLFRSPVSRVVQALQHPLHNLVAVIQAAARKA